MTYKDLVIECSKIPESKCSVECKYRKECNAFEEKTGVIFPYEISKILNFDLDSEIEVDID